MSGGERVTLPYDSAAVPTRFGFGIHHVQLSIPPGTEDEARAFYVGVLGLTEVRKPPVLAARGGLWVRADALELHLGVDHDFHPAGRAHPGLRVGDVAALEALAEHLEERGVAIERDANFPGYRRFHLRDPFGNRIEVLTPEA